MFLNRWKIRLVIAIVMIAAGIAMCMLDRTNLNLTNAGHIILGAGIYGTVINLRIGSTLKKTL